MTAHDPSRELDGRQAGAAAAVPGWVAPATICVVAAVTFAAFAIGGNPALGGLWAAVSLMLAAAMVLGRRTAPVRILGGVDDDERTRVLETRATAAMGMVLVAILAGLLLAAGVRGESGLVYGVLLLVAEATRLGAIAIQSRRN